MTDQKCSVSLHQKIADRAGRLQLIVAKLSEAVHISSNPRGDEEQFEEALWMLGDLGNTYGPEWLDECSMLLKELYNKERGP